MERVPKRFTLLRLNRYDTLGQTIRRHNLPVGLTSFTPGDGSCFIHALIDQAVKAEIDSFPKTVRDMRAAIVQLMLTVGFRKEHGHLIEGSWDDFCASLATPNAFLDESGRFVKAASQYVGRPFVIVHDGSRSPKDEPFYVIDGSLDERSLLPFFFGC